MCCFYVSVVWKSGQAMKRSAGIKMNTFCVHRNTIHVVGDAGTSEVVRY